MYNGTYFMQVMISTGVQEIPKSMIVQRWTKEARRVLPAELAQYRKDNPALLAQTYRHSSLMLRALHFVEMGNSNAQSYTMAMKILDEGIEALFEVLKKDGMGLGHSQSEDQECIPDTDQFNQFPQRAPKRKSERGWPSNKRQKASHEKLSKRPRFCRLCRSEKHTMQSCPDRDLATKKTRRPPTCSGCGVTGHSVDRCNVNQQQLASTEYMFL
jgi:hypothetical protein